MLRNPESATEIEPTSQCTVLVARRVNLAANEGQTKAATKQEMIIRRKGQNQNDRAEEEPGGHCWQSSLAWACRYGIGLSRRACYRPRAHFYPLGPPALRSSARPSSVFTLHR